MTMRPDWEQALRYTDARIAELKEKLATEESIRTLVVDKIASWPLPTEGVQDR